MDFGQGFQKALSIIKLDAKAVKDVSRDSGATGMALLLAAIGSAVGALLGGPFAIVAGAIFGVVGLFIGTAILWVIAMLFGGKAGFTDLMRPLGHSWLFAAVGLIPILGQLVMLWLIVVDIVIVKNVYNFSTGKAAAVVLIPVVVFGLIIAVLAAVLVATLGVMGLGSLGMLSAFQR